MLKLVVEAFAGDSLDEAFAIDMRQIADRVGCLIELEGNDIKFWVKPGDTEEALRAVFDEKYMKARRGDILQAPRGK